MSAKSVWITRQELETAVNRHRADILPTATKVEVVNNLYQQLSVVAQWGSDPDTRIRRGVRLWDHHVDPEETSILILNNLRDWADKKFTPAPLLRLVEGGRHISAPKLVYRYEKLVKDEAARITGEVLPDAAEVIVNDLTPHGYMAIAARWPDGLIHAFKWNPWKQGDTQALMMTKLVMNKLKAWHQDHKAVPEEPISA